LVKKRYLGWTGLEIVLFFQFFGFFNFGDLFQIYTKNMKIYKKKLLPLCKFSLKNKT